MTYEWFDGDPDAVTLEQARQWLRDRIDVGASCPCCQQLAKQYRRKLNSGMCRSLIRMFLAGGVDEWVDVTQTGIGGTREEGKLRWWSLVREADVTRDDGGRAGWWKVTHVGEQFLRGQVKLPSHVVLYDNKFRGFDGPPVDISDCLGSPFDLQELLAA